MNVHFPPTGEIFRINVISPVHIPKCRVSFDFWRREPINNTFGGKPLLVVGGKPMFAELAIKYDWAPADIPIVDQLKAMDTWN